MSARDCIDNLARGKSDRWTEAVKWYALEVLNDNQIMITGDVPNGTRRDGSPKWPRGKDAHPIRIVVSSEEYHAAIKAEKEASVGASR